VAVRRSSPSDRAVGPQGVLVRTEWTIPLSVAQLSPVDARPVGTPDLRRQATYVAVRLVAAVVAVAVSVADPRPLDARPAGNAPELRRGVACRWRSRRQSRTSTFVAAVVTVVVAVTNPPLRDAPTVVAAELIRRAIGVNAVRWLVRHVAAVVVVVTPPAIRDTAAVVAREHPGYTCTYAAVAFVAHVATVIVEVAPVRSWNAPEIVALPATDRAREVGC
jgi:hypothetical protein